MEIKNSENVEFSKVGNAVIKSVYGDSALDGEYDESYKRTMRKKYRVLCRDILMRSPSSFKNASGKNMVPDRDELIVVLLLKESLDGGDDPSLIVDWFNNKIDFENLKEVEALYQEINMVLETAEVQGNVDSVTIDEWRATLGASVNHETAERLIEIQKKLLDLQTVTDVLNHHINIGAVIRETSEGDRFYISDPNEVEDDYSRLTVSELLKKASSQKDYFDILHWFVEELEADAKSKSKEVLFKYLTAVKHTGMKAADDCVGTDSLASEYVIYYQRIYEFLVRHSDVLEELQKETGFEGIPEYFRMRGRE